MRAHLASRFLDRFLALLLVINVVLTACGQPQAPAAAPAPAPTSAPASQSQVQPTQASAAQPAATAPAAKPAQPAATVAAAKPADAIKRVPKLTVSVSQDGGPLNIYSTDSKLDFMVELVFDKLFAPSPYVATQTSGLAESATQIDPSNWVVKLRQGVTWHDGKPFTADDVKFTFESFRDGSPNRHTHHVSQVPRIDQIIAEDAQTVRFVCGYPCPTLAQITLADLPILPKHIWENVKEPLTYNQLPIGTGPYQLVEYKSDQLYRFKANESYFRGKPLADELVMPVIKDPNGTFTALRAGEIDAAARPVPPELIAEFQRTAGLKVASTSSLSALEIRLNFEKEPFGRPEFRRALSYAVDRQAIVDTVLLGQGRAGLQGYPHPDSTWTMPGLAQPFDRAESKKLLDQLQFVDRNSDGVRETPEGQSLEFVLNAPSNEPTYLRAAELVAKQFESVGIRVTVQPIDPGVVNRLLRSRQYEMYIFDIGPHGLADPDQFVQSHLPGYLWTEGLPYPEMDALFAEWKQAVTLEARKAVSFRMQELFNRQPTALVLYYRQDTWAYRPAAFDGWVESLGFGIIHKWSLLPVEARPSQP